MIYTVIFTNKAKEHLTFLNSKNKHLVKRYKKLIDSILINPRAGLGKPERLKHYSNREVWSRRVDHKNRLVYEIKEDQLIILSLWNHYY